MLSGPLIPAPILLKLMLLHLQHALNSEPFAICLVQSSHDPSKPGLLHCSRVDSHTRESHHEDVKLRRQREDSVLPFRPIGEFPKEEDVIGSLVRTEALQQALLDHFLWRGALPSRVLGKLLVYPRPQPIDNTPIGGDWCCFMVVVS